MNGNKRTLFVITADHGEMMGEHGYYFNHGWFLYEPLIKVPFILYAPGLVPAKKITPQIRAGLDLFPTLLSFLRIKKPKTVEGVPLLSLLSGENVGSSPYVLSDDGSLSVRADHWKLIRFFKENGPQRVWKLFDLKNDPGETVDLLSVEKRKFAILKERMDAYHKDFPGTKAAPPVLDEETRRKLRALGYLE
jgi:arylsulfatase A-like enzyme